MKHKRKHQRKGGVADPHGEEVGPHPNDACTCRDALAKKGRNKHTNPTPSSADRLESSGVLAGGGAWVCAF